MKLSDISSDKKGVIELQLGDDEKDIIKFHWKSPRSLAWSSIQTSASKGKLAEDEALRQILMESVTHYEDETGKHKFTEGVIDSLGTVADILVNALTEEVMPNFHRNRR